MCVWVWCVCVLFCIRGMHVSGACRMSRVGRAHYFAADEEPDGIIKVAPRAHE